MHYKKLWWTCLYLTIVVSVVMFFLVPKYEFIPKLLYLVIAVGFAVWHFVHRNLRAAIVCAFGALFVLMTMPNSRLLKTTELVLLAAACTAAYVVSKHVKNKAPREE
jgi:TctA family transporter